MARLPLAPILVLLVCAAASSQQPEDLSSLDIPILRQRAAAGEPAGLWYINADSPDVRYACFQANATTPQGNSCSALPF